MPASLPLLRHLCQRPLGAPSPRRLSPRQLGSVQGLRERSSTTGGRVARGAARDCRHCGQLGLLRHQQPGTPPLPPPCDGASPDSALPTPTGPPTSRAPPSADRPAAGPSPDPPAARRRMELAESCLPAQPGPGPRGRHMVPARRQRRAAHPAPTGSLASWPHDHHHAHRGPPPPARRRLLLPDPAAGTSRRVGSPGAVLPVASGHARRRHIRHPGPGRDAGCEPLPPLPTRARRAMRPRDRAHREPEPSPGAATCAPRHGYRPSAGQPCRHPGWRARYRGPHYPRLLGLGRPHHADGGLRPIALFRGAYRVLARVNVRRLQDWASRLDCCAINTVSGSPPPSLPEGGRNQQNNIINFGIHSLQKTFPNDIFSLCKGGTP